MDKPSSSAARWTFIDGRAVVLCPQGHQVERVPPWAGTCRCEDCEREYEIEG
ncbi:MAG: hypothetical protein ACHQC8_07635 [Solirubrobacterales bacterium]